MIKIIQGNITTLAVDVWMARSIAPPKRST